VIFTICFLMAFIPWYFFTITIPYWLA
jgi:hypothetical protein